MASFLDNAFVSWAQFGFMRMALLAAILLAPLLGLLGTMAVDGKMAFFADSLGHTALTGIAIGALLGLSAPLWAMLIFGVLYALLLSLVKARGKASTDTTISVFSSVGMALGIVLLSRKGGFPRYSSVLIGDLLAIEMADIIPIAATLALTVLYWAFLYNKLLLTQISGEIAASRGIRVRAVETSFACLLAIVVMLSIRWVGVLLISAMLILPSASARNAARNVRGYHLYSILIALFSAVSGLFLSYAFDLAPGATIVLVLAACYAWTLRRR